MDMATGMQWKAQPHLSLRWHMHGYGNRRAVESSVDVVGLASRLVELVLVLAR